MSGSDWYVVACLFFGLVATVFVVAKEAFRRIRALESQRKEDRDDHWRDRDDLSQLSFQLRQGFNALGLEWRPRDEAKWVKRP